MQVKQMVKKWNMLLSEEPWEKEDGFLELRKRFSRGNQSKQLIKEMMKCDTIVGNSTGTKESIKATENAPHNSEMELATTKTSDSNNTWQNTTKTRKVRDGLEQAYKGNQEKPTITYSNLEARTRNKMDADNINMEGSFLNNKYVNCCFITTYAGVLSSAIKKGSSWFLFVMPTIGSPVATASPPSPTGSINSVSTSGYESNDSFSMSTFSITSSNTSSPNTRVLVRNNNRITQKQRRQMEKEAREKAQLLNKKNDGQVSCPADHEIKPVPSKYYQFDMVEDQENGEQVIVVGMQKTTETVKVESSRNGQKGKKRSGNRNKNQQPALPPKKKEEIEIDEDGFQKVLSKKAAKPRQQQSEIEQNSNNTIKDNQDHDQTEKEVQVKKAPQKKRSVQEIVTRFENMETILKSEENAEQKVQEVSQQIASDMNKENTVEISPAPKKIDKSPKRRNKNPKKIREYSQNDFDAFKEEITEKIELKSNWDLNSTPKQLGQHELLMMKVHLKYLAQQVEGNNDGKLKRDFEYLLKTSETPFYPCAEMLFFRRYPELEPSAIGFFFSMLKYSMS